MAWARIDDNFWANPKIVGAGNEAAGVYVRGIAYCAAHLTDGVVPHSVVRLLTATRKPVGTLVANGLWEERDDGFLIPDYLDFNPSRAEVEAKREAQREGGRRGAAARWSHG